MKLIRQFSFLFIFLFAFNIQAQDLPFQDLVVDSYIANDLLQQFREVGFLSTTDKIRCYDKDLKLIGEYESELPDGTKITINDHGVAVANYSGVVDGKYKSSYSYSIFNDKFEKIIPFNNEVRIKYQAPNQYFYTCATENERLDNVIYDMEGKEIFRMPKDHFINSSINNETFIFCKKKLDGKYSSGIMNVKGEVVFESEDGAVFSNIISDKYIMVGDNQKRAVITLDKDLVWERDGTLNMKGSSYLISRDREKNTTQLFNVKGEKLLEGKLIYNTLYGDDLMCFSNIESNFYYIVYDNDLNVVRKFRSFNYTVPLNVGICRNFEDEGLSYIKEGIIYDRDKFYDKGLDKTESGYSIFQGISGRGMGLLNSEGDTIVDYTEGQYFEITKDGIIIKKLKGKYSFFDKDFKHIISPFVNINRVFLVDNEIIAFKRVKRNTNSYNSDRRNADGTAVYMRPPPPKPSPRNDHKPGTKEYLAKEKELINTQEGSRKLNYGWHFMNTKGEILFNGGFENLYPFVDDIAVLPHHPGFKDTTVVNKEGLELDVKVDMKLYEAAKKKMYSKSTRLFKHGYVEPEKYDTKFVDGNLVYQSDHTITYPSIVTELVFHDQHYSICKVSKPYYILNVNDQEKKEINGGYLRQVGDGFVIGDIKGETIVNDYIDLFLGKGVYVYSLFKDRAVITYKGKHYFLDLSKAK